MLDDASSRLACEHCDWDRLQFRAHEARPLSEECVYVVRWIWADLGCSLGKAEGRRCQLDQAEAWLGGLPLLPHCLQQGQRITQ